MRIMLIALATLATAAIALPIASQAEDAVVIKKDNGDHFQEHRDKKTVVIKEREHRDKDAVVIKDRDHDHNRSTTGLGVGVGVHVGDQR